MKQLAIGLVLGSSITFAIMVLYNPTSPSLTPAPVIPSSVSATLENAPGSPITANENQAIAPRQGETVKDQTPPSNANRNIARTLDSNSSQLDSITASEQTILSADQSQAVLITLDGLTDVHKTLMNNEINRLANQPTLPTLHTKFSAQDRDPAWSYYIEEQLKTFVGQLAAPVGIELVVVECRISLCEIQAQSLSSNAGREWESIRQAMTTQPWWREFSGSLSSTNGIDEKTVILTLLQRNENLP